MTANQTITTLADVQTFLEDYPAARKDLNALCSSVLTGAVIAAVLMEPTLTAFTALTGGASLTALKPSKFAGWLEKKLGSRRKKEFESKAIREYQTIQLAHVMIVHLSVRAGFIDHLEDLKKWRDGLKTTAKLDAAISSIKINHDRVLEDVIKFPENNGHVFKVVCRQQYQPLTLVVHNLNEKGGKGLSHIVYSMRDAAFREYQAYLLFLCESHPPFARVIEMGQRREMEKSLDAIKDEFHRVKGKQDEILTTLMERLKWVEFYQKSGLTKWEIGLRKLHKRLEGTFDEKLKAIEECFQANVRADIRAHHKELSSYPKGQLLGKHEKDSAAPDVRISREDIYIPQSYSMLRYRGQNILSGNDWDEIPGVVNGGDPGKELLRCLFDPISITTPIVILGNPGSGKSMFTNIFAARLCQDRRFMPFYMRFRDLRGEQQDTDFHIREGLARSIGKEKAEISDWLEACKSHLPVLFLDGFDELQAVEFHAGSTLRHGYLTKLAEIQKRFFIQREIPLRIVITSRLNFMSRVEIPLDSQVIKLNPFDAKRQFLWQDQWNALQKKHFQLPDHPRLKELAQEPLLLFLLALYDEGGEGNLQELVDLENFQDAQLYDRIIDHFIKRQVKKKAEAYTRELGEDQKIEALHFRLGLGLAALLMFQKENAQQLSSTDLDHGLKYFGFKEKEMTAKKIFDGFFFHHVNKAESRDTFEFLHRTFGEFLAADLLLRLLICKKKLKPHGLPAEFLENNKRRFAWGSQWFARTDDETLRFLHELTKIILHEREELLEQVKFECADICKNLPPENMAAVEMALLEKKIKEGREKCISTIQSELRAVFSEETIPFPVKTPDGFPPKSILDHLAIYSQNLMLGWEAIKDSDFSFDIYQDAKKNRETWLKMVQLWEIAGKEQAGLPAEWMSVREEKNEQDEVTIWISPAKGHSGSPYRKFADLKMSVRDQYLDYFMSNQKLAGDDLERFLDHPETENKVAILAYCAGLGDDCRAVYRLLKNGQSLCNWGRDVSENIVDNIEDAKFSSYEMRFKLLQELELPALFCKSVGISAWDYGISGHRFRVEFDHLKSLEGIYFGKPYYIYHAIGVIFGSANLGITIDENVVSKLLGLITALPQKHHFLKRILLSVVDYQTSNAKNQERVNQLPHSSSHVEAPSELPPNQASNSTE